MKEVIDHPFLIRLSRAQQDQLVTYQEQLLHLNQRINLISRDTAPFFAERHILHSLALTHRGFPDGCTVVDWGTGGGLPAIPLAIAFPMVHVHAIDAVGKKIQAIQVMARRLDLDNVHPWQGRAEDWPGTLDYSVSRATAPLLDLWHWHVRARTAATARFSEDHWENHWGPGLIALKGGDLSAEIAALTQVFPNVNIKKTDLEPLLARSYFKDKYIVEIYECPSDVR